MQVEVISSEFALGQSFRCPPFGWDANSLDWRQRWSPYGLVNVMVFSSHGGQRLQYEGYLHREESNAAILALSKDGVAIKEIVRRTGHNRGTVRRVLPGERSDVFRTRETSL